MQHRELRNIEAYAYSDDLERFLTRIRAAAERLKERKELLLVRLKERIGDQRIDLTIATPDQVAGGPVLSRMRAGGVRLA